MAFMDTTALLDTPDTLLVTTLARGRLTLKLSPRLMPTPLARSMLDFPLPMLLPLVMPTTLDTLPTNLCLLLDTTSTLTLPTLDITAFMDTTALLDTPDTLLVTTLARGRLTLKLRPRLMPTPLARSMLDFPLPMLLLLVMPTTLDTLPTRLCLPLDSTDTPTLSTMDTVDSTTVSTTTKCTKKKNQNE